MSGSNRKMTYQKTTYINGLDHAALIVRDLYLSATIYQRLGFCVTPISQHSGALVPSGEVLQWGCANHCIMFEQGYLELMGIIDTNLYDNKISEFLARYEGIHILAFGCVDCAATANHLADNGFGANGVHLLTRSVDTPRGERTVKFNLTRLPPGQMREGRILAIKHLTPKYLWQDRYMTHANGAIGLEEIIVCVEDPATTVIRYERYFGQSAIKTNDLWRFTFQQGNLVLMEPKTLRAQFNINVTTIPYIAAAKIRTQTLKKTKKFMEKNSINHMEMSHGLQIPASEASGTTIIFTE